MIDKTLIKVKKVIPRKIFRSLQPAYHYFLNLLAAIIYKRPSEKLIVIGVTGTTGKTTSTYLIAKMLEGAGLKTGYTSTAMFNDGQNEWLNDKKMTMPGRFFTQKMLSRMVKNGCKYAVVETTSEGIRQFRHRFINYDILIFTGLYPEHIESHGSFENYKQAKGKLFEHLKKCKTKYANDEQQVCQAANDIKKLDFHRIKKTVIVNYDDEHVDYFLQFWAEEKIGYTLGNKKGSKDLNLVHYDDIEMSQVGLSFKVEKEKYESNLLGAFNASNVMNAICVMMNQGLDYPVIQESLSKINGVPGRLEKIESGQDFVVIVDYAFEPNAITKLYETVELIPHNKIIHVLGSTGGGRDSARRPINGRIAGERADYVIVTDEDPYDENPEIIADQVLVGAEKGGKKQGENLWKIMDRREAIKKALILAEEDDLVLITGKGSEQGICVADGKIIPWDDRKVAKEEIEKILVDKVKK